MFLTLYGCENHIFSISVLNSYFIDNNSTQSQSKKLINSKQNHSIK
jgi:hypothetical protein